jgi:hypothetical protein
MRALFVGWYSNLYLDKVTFLGRERCAFWVGKLHVVFHMPWNTANRP